MKLKHLFAAAFALAITYSGISSANTLNISDMDSGSETSFDGGYGEHGHGGHGHGGYHITCTARNGRGHLFSARGSAMRRHQVQQHALNHCRMNSRYCVATGCY